MKEYSLSPAEISREEFRKAGYLLIDLISGFINEIDERPVTTGEAPEQISKVAGYSTIPEDGSPPEEILKKASDFLFNHSLLNGHPKFFGYITSSPAPIGALADMLASAVNPNVGANILSPAATEIEKQTISMLAELCGLPSSWGGLLVSGGNMANITAFLTARAAKAPGQVKKEGVYAIQGRMVFYCSHATHAWAEKAAIHSGIGTDAIRWVETVEGNRMDVTKLDQTISQDIENGFVPFMVVGNAGDVSMGSVDDLRAIAGICSKYNLWFHVDGAYGLPATILPEMREKFSGLEAADSIAIDPHKWLYCPLEVGCTLVKDPEKLRNTFSAHPAYYNFGEKDSPEHNYYEYGLQNSRGFRALKVWCILQHVGRKGYEKMIRHDINMAELLYEYAIKNPEIEAVSHNLSITTFRYVPPDRNYSIGNLNELNEMLLNELQKGGRLFLSNAVIDGKYCLRVCVVNFRTREKDIKETIEIIVGEGRKVHSDWRQRAVAEKMAQSGA